MCVAVCDGAIGGMVLVLVVPVVQESAAFVYAYVRMCGGVAVSCGVWW